MRKSLCFLILVATTMIAEPSSAEPGWSPVIIATGEYREQIKSTPIELRPYRPLHFYGNTVRRNYYRGTILPLPRDFWGLTVVALSPRFLGY